MLDPDETPTGLSTVATVGLLILAIGVLAAVGAWLWAWYQGRNAAAVGAAGRGRRYWRRGRCTGAEAGTAGAAGAAGAAAAAESEPPEEPDPPA